MTNDKFDRELNTLYQQRKSHITAPEITLNERPSLPKRKPLQLMAIMLTGGCASFAIMAIISHLSPVPKITQPSSSNAIQIDLKETVVIQEANTTIIIKQSLPPEPITNRPSSLQEIAPTPVAPTKPISPEAITLAPATENKLPTIEISKIDLDPVLKIMPKYPRNLALKEVGVIKLRYTITADGRVSKPKVLDSNVVNSLEKSTKKALLQWRYKPDARFPLQHEIIFEFEPTRN